MPKRRPPRAGALTELPPPKILTKIVLLQAAYYTSATVLILFTSLVFGEKFHLDLIFDWETIRGDTTVGWTLGLCWMLNGLISVIYLLVLVSRSKLVLDFSLTIHFLHLIVTSLYSHSLPMNFLWWGLQASSEVLLYALGVWACRWRELRPMDFGAAAAKLTSGATNHANGDSEVSNEEEGFSRGRGRGRGRDGGGEYEMVGINGSANGGA